MKRTIQNRTVFLAVSTVKNAELVNLAAGHVRAAVSPRPSQVLPCVVGELLARSQRRGHAQ
jgi:hypothetical protein